MVYSILESSRLSEILLSLLIEVETSGTLLESWGNVESGCLDTGVRSTDMKEKEWNKRCETLELSSQGKPLGDSLSHTSHHTTETCTTKNTTNTAPANKHSRTQTHKQTYTAAQQTNTLNATSVTLPYGGIVYTPKLSLTIKRCLPPRPRKSGLVRLIPTTPLRRVFHN